MAKFISESLKNDSLMHLMQKIEKIVSVQPENGFEFSWSNLIESLLTGLITSIVFLLILYFIKPRLKISDKICKYQFRDGEPVYLIKVINKSLWPIYDISAELTLGMPYNGNKGQHMKYSTVKLNKDKVFYTPAFRPWWKLWKENKADYALLFSTKEDLSKIWDGDNKILNFRVMCRHGLSGFTTVKKQAYFSKDNDLVIGQFEWGNSINQCK